MDTKSLLLLALLPSQAFASIALNPDVRPDTIHATICAPGYTKTVRPATSYTNGVKRKLMRETGEEGEMSDYALDHAIPLVLGGSPRSIDNLRLLSPHDNSRKSRVEVKLQCLVCTGQLQLKQAQHEIYEDWGATYHRYSTVKCRR